MTASFEDGFAAGVRTMDMASEAMAVFNRACIANDWAAADLARLRFLDVMDVYFDHIASAHRCLAESHGQ